MKSSSLVPSSDGGSTSHSYPSLSVTKYHEPFLPCSNNLDNASSAILGCAESSSGSPSAGSYAIQPSAIVLRLRVTQICASIMTIVLGSAAVIEERGDFRIGSGVVAGFLSLAASIASIRATFNERYRNEDRARWIIQYVNQTSASCTSGGVNSGDCGGQSMLLSTLWALAVVSNMVMLAFVFMAAFPSSNRNLIIIGALELFMGLVVLSILVANLFLALRYRGRQKR